MLRHKVIPAQVSFKNLNPKIPSLDIDNTIICTENVPWLPVTEDERRFALINNFGASGSNATMIIEEYVAAPTKPPPSDVASYVFALSAKDDAALEKMRTNLICWLQANKETSLADLSYTLMARRQIYTHRLVVTASTTEELSSRLGLATVHTRQQDSPVVFVFSGLGSQSRGMGSALYLSCSVFKKCIDECDSILRAANFGSILPVIANISDDKSDYPTEEVYQTAVFSLEYALAMLWISWGIKPTAVVGHR
jgi:acyl transferase domain-containing protein